MAVGDGVMLWCGGGVGCGRVWCIAFVVSTFPTAYRRVELRSVGLCHLSCVDGSESLEDEILEQGARAWGQRGVDRRVVSFAREEASGEQRKSHL